jgi:putative flippase GtrA
LIAINDKMKRFIKFGFVGGIGIIVDFSIFSACAFIFKNIIPGQIINIMFPVIAYETAVINNFLFSYYWVWKDRKQKLSLAFIKYNLSTAVAFLIRLAFFNGSLYVFNISAETKIAASTQFLGYVAVYGISIGIGMLINFIFMEFKVFKVIEK